MPSLSFKLGAFFLLIPTVSAGQRVVYGRVVDDSTHAVLGAVSVQAVRSALVTQTDSAGTYRLLLPPGALGVDTAIDLVFSRLGYHGTTHRLTRGGGDSVRLDVTLRRSVIYLRDVVTLGTGANLPDSPTAPIRIRGRGQPSAASPITVVDGVAVADTDAHAIRPEEIASIEILKGPTASAMYGAEASNGVVVITTRRQGYRIGSRRGALRWTADFPWPPPQWTNRYDVPDELLSGATLGDVYGHLREALRNARIDEWAVYPVADDGFVLILRRETIDESGRYLGPAEPRSAGFSWGRYFTDLLFAKPGRYRIVALAVTPGHITAGHAMGIEQMTQLVLDESGRLPAGIASRRLTAETHCTALVYEFYRPAEDSPIRLVTRSRISPVEHLAGAQLWTLEQLRGGGR